MIHANKTWFTLIELIVAISIFFLLSLIAFAPYSFYLNKSKVKHTSKEISQVIYEAKNKAINGSATASWNVSIWIYFDSTWANKNSYKLLSFSHDINENIISMEEANLIEETILQPGMQLWTFQWQEKGMIFFRSITGSWRVFTWDWNIRTQVPPIEDITLKYSYKWASYWLLQWELQYFQETQIVDY